jgi:hypothetical protein
MFSRRENSFQLIARAPPLGAVLEENPLTGHNPLTTQIGESRSLFTSLQRTQSPQELLCRHSQQGLWWENSYKTMLHKVVERSFAEL